MKPLYIFDLDGTIALCDHRKHWLDRADLGGERWRRLWEAEWRRVAPRDPYLLRHVGGDIWVVLAAWDLTEVERAAMATRLNG
jgi:hypothetical protein